jgi:hypothetical protein
MFMKNSIEETLEESLNNPESWIRQAEQQYLVADSIAENVKDLGRDEKSTLKSVGFLKATTLMLALCIENALKGIKAAKGMFSVDTRGLTKKSRGGGGTGHSPLDLAAEIDFSLSEQEVMLLQRFSEIGIWAEKYHTPIRHDTFENYSIKSPKSLALPSDLVAVKSILTRAANLSGVQSVVL